MVCVCCRFDPVCAIWSLKSHLWLVDINPDGVYLDRNIVMNCDYRCGRNCINIHMLWSDVLYIWNGDYKVMHTWNQFDWDVWVHRVRKGRAGHRPSSVVTITFTRLEAVIITQTYKTVILPSMVSIIIGCWNIYQNVLLYQTLNTLVNISVISLYSNG